jgi:tetratricopeptide (TPR) repeat protein
VLYPLSYGRFGVIFSRQVLAMRTSERHHLKDNELALALGHAGDFATRHKRTMTMTIVSLVLVVVATGAFFAWRNNVEAKSREALAKAMVINEARVVPPAPSPEGIAPKPAAGTYPTEKAKLEAALPQFMAAADAYPSSDAGRTARFHAASVLVALGRYDEAIKQYDQLMSAGGLLGQSARLGKADAQLRAGQHDAAIASFKELSEKADITLPKGALLLELARAYKVAGKTDDAKKTLNLIVEQHADSPAAAAAKQELEKIAG